LISSDGGRRPSRCVAADCECESDDGEQEQKAQGKAKERERPVCLHAIDLHDTTSVSVKMAHDNEVGRIVVPQNHARIKVRKILYDAWT